MNTSPRPASSTVACARSGRWAATDLYTRCNEKARDVLDENHPEPVPGDVVERVHAIVEEADRAAGAKGLMG